MMQIAILGVGKVKESFLVMGINEYLRRMTPYARISVIEVIEEPFGPQIGDAERSSLLSREAEKLLRHIKDGTFLIALDREGRQMSSEAMAALFERLALDGQSHVTFVIGGPLGLASSILKRADRVLSFSAMTFPHQLFRLMLVEQIYRAFKISRGEPYHW